VKIQFCFVTFVLGADVAKVIFERQSAVRCELGEKDVVSAFYTGASIQELLPAI
jgi:hypothetical protein